MFPLRDDVPSRRAPVVTWALVGVNVAVFLAQLLLSRDGVTRLFYLHGLVPARFSSPAWASSVGLPAGSPLDFVTSQFLHGGLWHVASNLWILWIFGDNVEDRMGRPRFVLFYLLGGVVSGAVHAISDLGSTVPTVGASGAIAAVLGAYLRWYPGARVLTVIPIFIFPLLIEVPALVFLGLWFVGQLFSGVFSFGLPEGVGGVAWWAHVGGFLFGVATADLFATRGRPSGTGDGPARHYVVPHLVPRRRLPREPF